MSEDVENDLDPRIQIELETLNSTTDEINRLETEYDVCKNTNQPFQIITNQLNSRKQTRLFVCF